MQTWIYFLALHSFTWWTLVKSAIYVWNGNDYDRFESISNFESSDRVYQCHLHYEPDDFCSAPSTNVTVSFKSGCIAALITESDCCNLEKRVHNADDWLKRLGADMDYDFVPILIIAGLSSEVGDDCIPEVVGPDFGNTSCLVVTTSYRTGVVLIQNSVDTVRVDGKQPSPLEERGETEDLVDEQSDNPSRETELPTEPPLENDSTGGGITNGPLVLLVFAMLMLFFVAILNCWPRLEEACTSVGDTSLQPSTASVPVAEKTTVLTESQVNQLVNASLDNEEVDTTKELSLGPCAICIEDCDKESIAGSLIMTLPCQHRFHVDCIVPWLTKRKAQCPLCNDDLLRRVDCLPAV